MADLPELDAEERAMADAGLIINAIKHYRNRTGQYLRESKEAMDRYLGSRAFTPPIDWRSLAERMAGALGECVQELDGDGQPCWCAIPSMIPYRGHDVGCEAVRSALAEYDAAKGTP